MATAKPDAPRPPGGPNLPAGDLDPTKMNSMVDLTSSNAFTLTLFSISSYMKPALPFAAATWSCVEPSCKYQTVPIAYTRSTFVNRQQTYCFQTQLHVVGAELFVCSRMPKDRSHARLARLPHCWLTHPSVLCVTALTPSISFTFAPFSISSCMQSSEPPAAAFCSGDRSSCDIAGNTYFDKVANSVAKGSRDHAKRMRRHRRTEELREAPRQAISVASYSSRITSEATSRLQGYLMDSRVASESAVQLFSPRPSRSHLHPSLPAAARSPHGRSQQHSEAVPTSPAISRMGK